MRPTFPRKFEPLFHKSRNIPLEKFPAKFQKKSLTSFCRSAGRTKDGGSLREPLRSLLLPQVSQIWNNAARTRAHTHTHTQPAGWGWITVEVPWTWQRESRGQQPKSLEKVSKTRTPKNPKEVSKSSSKAPETRFHFLGLFGPFSRFFSQTFVRSHPGKPN